MTTARPCSAAHSSIRPHCMACSEKCVISACHCSRSIAPTPARQMRQILHSALKHTVEKGDWPLNQARRFQPPGIGWATTRVCRFNAIVCGTIGNSRIDKKEQNDDHQRAYLSNDRTRGGGGVPGGVRGRHWREYTHPIHSRR